MINAPALNVQVGAQLQELQQPQPQPESQPQPELQLLQKLSQTDLQPQLELQSLQEAQAPVVAALSLQLAVPAVVAAVFAFVSVA
jgi:hypothetical protein